jgi:KEOPS complex subunit Cgi121
VAGARLPRGQGPEILGRVKALPRASEVQLLDSHLVFGRDHLISASEHALRAFARGTNSAFTVALETLVYASGERQIHEALTKMGLSEATEEVAIVDLGGEVGEDLLTQLGLHRDDGVLEPGEKYLEEYGIAPGLRATVPPGAFADLVLERVALVDLLK